MAQFKCKPSPNIGQDFRNLWSETRKRRQSKFSASTSLTETKIHVATCFTPLFYQVFTFSKFSTSVVTHHTPSSRLDLTFSTRMVHVLLTIWMRIWMYVNFTKYYSLKWSIRFRCFLCLICLLCLLCLLFVHYCCVCLVSTPCVLPMTRKKDRILNWTNTVNPLTRTGFFLKFLIFVINLQQRK